MYTPFYQKDTVDASVCVYIYTHILYIYIYCIYIYTYPCIQNHQCYVLPLLTGASRQLPRPGLRRTPARGRAARVAQRWEGSGFSRFSFSQTQWHPSQSSFHLHFYISKLFFHFFSSIANGILFEETLSNCSWNLNCGSYVACKDRVVL